MHKVQFTFEEGCSIGRFITSIIKIIKELEKTKEVDEYWVINPGNLSFSKSLEFLVSKYKAKYEAGGRSKGPFFIKSPCFLFKLIFRGMLRYKNKHQKIYKKLRLDDNSNMEFEQKIHVVARENLLTKKVYLHELMKKISNKSQ